MGASFQASIDMLHIRPKSVQFEFENSMTVAERYHTPARGASNIITREAIGLGKEGALQMAVVDNNDYFGPDSLVPTLLLYSALQRLELPSDIPAPSTSKRAAALKAQQSLSRNISQ